MLKVSVNKTLKF